MNYIFTPGGVSQLLTQIAALSSAGHDITGGTVFSTCYFFGQSMAESMRQACQAFRLAYQGNIAPTLYHSRTVRRASLVDKTLWLLSPRHYHKILLQRHGWRPMQSFDSALVVCIRPWVYDELLLYSAIRPKNLFCVIDGVNSRDPQRALRGLNWRGLTAPFRNLPANTDVHCPSYLAADAGELGAARVIPNEVQDQVYTTYRGTRLATQFTTLLDSFANRHENVGFVFSQQLAQAGHLTFDQEQFYYLTAISSLRQLGYEKIIFKPHPRDPPEKIRGLRKSADNIGTALLIPPQKFHCLPIEPFCTSFFNGKHAGLSTTSTSLLGLRALTGAHVLSLGCPFFSADFEIARKTFCRKQNVKDLFFQTPDPNDQHPIPAVRC